MYRHRIYFISEDISYIYIEVFGYTLWKLVVSTTVVDLYDLTRHCIQFTISLSVIINEDSRLFDV